MNQDLDAFQKQIGTTFADPNILRQAFTHRSYINEHRDEGLAHNERLEFLGDAVLELVVTDHLYHAYPDKPEGELTAYRAALVNTQTLAEQAEALSMNEHLLLSKGEARDTGRARQYILANTFEAVLGAIYLDQGYDAAKEFLLAHLVPRLSEIVEKRLWQDAKSHFQEKAQEVESTTPVYETIEESGPDHDKTFVVGVYLGGALVAQGTGRSKQEAEQAAAAAGLAARGW